MKKLKKKLGQNTAEYLIMLTLVAVGSIGLMTAFGKTIQSKLAFLSAAVSGDTAKYEEAQTLTSNAAAMSHTRAKEKSAIKMKGIDKTELELKEITAEGGVSGERRKQLLKGIVRERGALSFARWS